MKIYITSFLVFIAVHAQTIASAQLPEFYVHFVKGTVVKLKPDKTTVALKQFDYIKNDERVILKSAKNEVTLVDKDNNFYVLRVPDTFSVAEIRGKKEVRQHSPYVSLMEEFWHHIRILENTEKISPKNIAGNIGGPDRGNNDCDPAIFPAGGTRTSADSLEFSWTTDPKATGWVFVVKDKMNKELFRKSLTDTTIRLMGTELKSKLATQSDENVLAWSVLPQGTGCRLPVDHSLFLLAPGKEQDNLLPLLKKIKATDPVEYNMRAADLMAVNGYYYKAADYYAKAKSLWQSRGN